jgi:hypothetical protein
MTTVGDVLDEFFSPFSSERLWIMPESDGYTAIVKQWQPVIDATNRTKQHLVGHCAQWSANYVTNPTWRPTKTDAPKPSSYREFVPSPPGTDPDTCRNAFVVYATSKAARTVPLPILPLPEIQTRNLYTCSIGSFNVYTTVDGIDCATSTATMSFWMYNAMSKRSFGRFASHPAFSLSRMATQYMWWNWVESVDWSSGMLRTVPRATGANRW